MSEYNTSWKTVLALDAQRQRLEGSEEDLASAIRRGANLRIYTEFRHNEHLDTSSDNDELVQEVSEFGVTYLLDDRWVAGIMSLRQPIVPPLGFGPRPSMSFFLYNQNGQQAIARPFLDQVPPIVSRGESPLGDFSSMPKYTQLDNWDEKTNAPSQNFVYEFGTYRFCVRDDWKEVLSHTSTGEVISGSLDSLTDAFRTGAEIKIAFQNLNEDLSTENPCPHEVFVQAGPGYYHTQQQLFVAGSHPVIRVRPAIPLKYQSENWDFGWLMARTDGHVSRSLVNPYTLQFTNSISNHGLRWFVR